MKHLILIGGGVMGGALAARWHATKTHTLHVVEMDAARRHGLAAQHIASYPTLAEAPRGDLYLLAIKPQQFVTFREELARVVHGASPLLMSIMAGVSLTDLHRISPRAIRIMPNLPALIGESMSVLCAPTLDAASTQIATDLFSLIGAVAWVNDESQLHSVTAISGSGPAYVFALMEALQQAATAQAPPRT